jgi:hypothetical protein
MPELELVMTLRVEIASALEVGECGGLQAHQEDTSGGT